MLSFFLQELEKNSKRKQLHPEEGCPQAISPQNRSVARRRRVPHRQGGRGNNTQPGYEVCGGITLPEKMVTTNHPVMLKQTLNTMTRPFYLKYFI